VLRDRLRELFLAGELKNKETKLLMGYKNTNKIEIVPGALVLPRRNTNCHPTKIRNMHARVFIHTAAIQIFVNSFFVDKMFRSPPRMIALLLLAFPSKQQKICAS
jgi:hypothetical protein